MHSKQQANLLREKINGGVLKHQVTYLRMVCMFAEMCEGVKCSTKTRVFYVS